MVKAMDRRLFFKAVSAAAGGLLVGVDAKANILAPAKEVEANAIPFQTFPEVIFRRIRSPEFKQYFVNHLVSGDPLPKMFIIQDVRACFEVAGKFQTFTFRLEQSLGPHSLKFSHFFPKQKDSTYLYELASVGVLYRDGTIDMTQVPDGSPYQLTLNNHTTNTLSFEINF